MHSARSHATLYVLQCAKSQIRRTTDEWRGRSQLIALHPRIRRCSICESSVINGQLLRHCLHYQASINLNQMNFNNRINTTYTIFENFKLRPSWMHNAKQLLSFEQCLTRQISSYINSFTYFLIIKKKKFQQLQVQISQTDTNGYVAFCDKNSSFAALARDHCDGIMQNNMLLNNISLITYVSRYTSKVMINNITYFLIIFL